MVKAAEKRPRARKLPEPVSKPLTAYIQAAMGHAEYEIMEGEEKPLFGHVVPCKGVWANGKTLEECRNTLQEVLEEWMILGFRLGHDMPVIDGIDLNYSREPVPDA